MVVDDAVGIGPVLAPVGRRSARIDRLDRSPPDERVKPRTRCSFLVTRDPAQSAVVGRQCHRHPLAVVTRTDTVVEIAVVRHEGAQRQDGLKGRSAPARVKPSDPAGGRRHELGHALGAHGRDGAGAPGALLMDLCGERRDRCVHAPDDTGITHELRPVLLGCTRHVGRRRRQRGAAGHEQHDQVSAETDELLAHHSPSATARMTAAAIAVRRIVETMKGIS